MLVPTAVCAAGFAALPLPRYVKLNVDSPLAMLNGRSSRSPARSGWARVLLVVATLVAAQLLLMARLFLPARAVAIGSPLSSPVALPRQAVYAFDRLFAVNGTNGLPITLDQGSVFNWIDRAVGAGGDVTMLRYPVNSVDYCAGVQYWWDVEFWNESVVESPTSESGCPGRSRGCTSSTSAPETPVVWSRRRTWSSIRRTCDSGSPAGSESSTAARTSSRRTGRGARASSRPGSTATVGRGRTRPPAIRIFALPGTTTPLKRFLTISLAVPASGDHLVTISSNLERWRGTIAAGGLLERLTTVCVPAGGYGEIKVETPNVSNIYRDPTKAALTGQTDRPAGLLVRWLALADETEPVAANTRHIGVEKLW